MKSIPAGTEREGPSVSGPLTLGLAALLCLLFCLSLLPLGGASAEAEVTGSLAAAPERMLTGADDPERPAAELLPGETLDLNSASAEELRKLPGIGEKLAAAVVDYLEEHGPFQSVEELLEVPGIGEKRLDAIRELVSVEPGQ